jgi:sulfhydrogenase subunit alpha
VSSTIKVEHPARVEEGATRTIKVEHLARVEGHGGITVELEGNRVSSVRFDLFEGARLLEGLLRGRYYTDVAPTISRICSICSAAHTITSLKATEDAFGVQVTEQTELLRDLLFRGESIESHALHVFLLAAPDYLGYPSAIAMAADHIDHVALGLRLKKMGNLVQSTIGGREIHPVNCVPGGFGAVPEVGQLVELKHGLEAALDDAEAAIDFVSRLPAADFCEDDIAFAALAGSPGFSYHTGASILLESEGRLQTFPVAEYRSLTNERTVPHSHAKHSQVDGRPFMVGSLARLALRRDRLLPAAAAALDRLGLTFPATNPMDNNKAQAVELVHDVEQALRIVNRLLEDGVRPERPAEVRPRAGTGTAVTEAPRGLLVHSYTYDDAGRIEAADVITPTAMNAASVERHFRVTVDQSHQRDDAALTRKLEMIARAYDPCISCSVHLVRRCDAG